jgi:hypothetical protein
MKEIIFVVEDAMEGGFNARALGVTIFTQTDNDRRITAECP